MNIETRDFQVQQALRTMGVEFEREDNIIRVEDDWVVCLPITESSIVGIIFCEDTAPAYAANIAIRFSSYLNNAGIGVEILCPVPTSDSSSHIGFVSNN